MMYSEIDGPAIRSILAAKSEQRFGIERTLELKDDLEALAQHLDRLFAEPLSIDDEA